MCARDKEDENMNGNEKRGKLHNNHNNNNNKMFNIHVEGGFEEDRGRN